MLFAWDYYSPGSPLGSIKGVFETLEDVKVKIEELKKDSFEDYDCYQVFDIDLQQEIIIKE